jgi:cell wall-associated NlpC family hydrolase
MSRLTHAVVSLAALDVRRRPNHRAELTNQLLLGEVVRVLGPLAGGQWWRVEGLLDGYRGWVRGWGLVRVPPARARSWQQKAASRVAVSVTQATAGAGQGLLVSPLFLGSRVIAGRRRGAHRRVELPDGRRGWVPDSALAGRRATVPLEDRIRSLLGVPYHWGGRTALGLDCSGLTQLVLAEQGLGLPRDAAHQLKASRRLLKGEEPGPGDLVFFAAPGRPPGHVGIGLGGGYFAHCRGMVRISSVESSNPLCDRELMPQLMGWRRPMATTHSGLIIVRGKGESA